MTGLHSDGLASRSGVQKNVVGGMCLDQYVRGILHGRSSNPRSTPRLSRSMRIGRILGAVGQLLAVGHRRAAGAAAAAAASPPAAAGVPAAGRDDRHPAIPLRSSLRALVQSAPRRRPPVPSSPSISCCDWPSCPSGALSGSLSLSITSTLPLSMYYHALCLCVCSQIGRAGAVRRRL